MSKPTCHFRSFRLALAAAFSLGVLATPADADHHQAGESSGAQPIIAKVHADWCGTCTKLGPTWEQLEQQYGDETQMVVFDVTDKATIERSREKAKELGLLDFFSRYRSKTGTIAVIDGNTHEPVAVLKGEFDLQKYADAVARARES